VKQRTNKRGTKLDESIHVYHFELIQHLSDFEHIGTTASHGLHTYMAA